MHYLDQELYEGVSELLTNVERYPKDLILRGKLRVEEIDKEQKEALKQKTKEDASKARKKDYLRSLKSKLHE